MKILICGSTSINDKEEVYRIIDHLFGDKENLTIIQGMAIGVDQIARQWAKERGHTVEDYPITKEDWRLYGKAAGPVRNKKMYIESRPDVVLAIWNGKSTGTKNMIGIAKKGRTPVIIHYPPTSEDPENIF